MAKLTRLPTRRTGVSEEALRVAFDTDPVPTAVLGDGSPLTVVEVNGALARLVGVPPSLLRGVPVDALLHAEDLLMPGPAGGVGRGRSGIVRLRQAGGAVLAIEATVTALPDDPATVVLHVLSDSVGAGELLQLAQELSTPLTSIIGAVELLSDGEAGDLTPAQTELLAMAQRNGARLAAIVDHLLELDPAASGPVPGEERHVDDVVREEVRRIRAGGGQQHQVELELSGPRVDVACPAPRLARVLAELLANATAYTPVGGSVRVRVSTEPDEVRLSVTDNGAGIPADELDLVFERFQRGSNAAALRPTGPGLGLAAVRRLVEGCGGRVELESVVGVGSRFTVALPRAT